MNRLPARSLVALLSLGVMSIQLAGCAPDASSDVSVERDALARRGVIPDLPEEPITRPVTRPPAPTPLPVEPDPPTPVARQVLPTTNHLVQTLETGAGWRRVQLAGSAVDGSTGGPVTLSGEYYVINGRNAIAGTTLVEGARQALINKMKAAPALADDDEEIIIVPVTLNQTAQADVAALAFCDDDNGKSFSKTYAIDESYPYAIAPEDKFVGRASFYARLHGALTASVRYDIKRTLCVPIPVIRRVSVSASADLYAEADIDATFKRNDSREVRVAAPIIGTVALPVIPIPITFSVPITAGMDVSSSGQVRAHAAYNAHGEFDVGCSSRGCDGSKSASHGFTPTGAPILGVKGRVTVTPWVKAALHANVVSDDFAYAEVGVKASLRGDAWGYTGNGCGDANDDGTPEFVSASTLDLGVSIDIVAAAGFFGSDYGPWPWNIWNAHLVSWGTGMDTLNPIFYATASAPEALLTANLHGQMRPCWPHTDDVTYQVTWNDGTTSLFTGAPGALLPMDHTYDSYGDKPVNIVAVSDAAGRTLGGASQANAHLTKTQWLGWGFPDDPSKLP